MVAITSHAEKIGLSPTGSTAALERILQKFHLPITYDLSHSEELFHAITHDKKARGSQLNIILLEKIGQAKNRTCSYRNIQRLLRRTVRCVI